MVTQVLRCNTDNNHRQVRFAVDIALHGTYFER